MLRICALLLLGVSLFAAVEVPADVATALKAARDADAPERALAALAAYHGKPHALIDLSIAQAHHRLAGNGPDNERDAHRIAAKQAYEDALRRDPGLRAARWGLARLAADAGEWNQASALAAEALDLAATNAAELQFVANAALRAGDRRLAAALIDAALIRFPGDTGLRRIDLALLIDGDRGVEARAAALDLLDHTIADRDLWLHLARADQLGGHDDEALMALEAALACDDGNRALRGRLAEGFLAKGWPQAALPHFAKLMDGSPADARLVELAARCAYEAGNSPQARAWIDAVPDQQRGRGLRLLAARIAVEQGDAATAAATLEALVALGESDPGVLIWAGALAETRGDETRAAAFFSQAMAGTGPAANAARLRLAALRLRQGLLDEAATLIDAHLQRNPDDATAHSLRAALDQRRPKR